MKRPITRFTIICGCVLILLLTATGQGGCDTGSESGMLSCIPDLKHAQTALAQRRGTRFIALLQKTGYKYIRSDDFDCLYAMVKSFDKSSLTIREARYLLLYRIIAQMGQKYFVGAYIDYDWLINMPGVKTDPDFNKLMESLISRICSPAVNRFKHNVNRLYTAHLAAGDGDSKAKEENLYSYLFNFSDKRMMDWDFLTLKRCFESVDPRRLSIEEQRIFYSTLVTVNLQLSRVDNAYRAWMACRNLSENYPWEADSWDSLETTFGEICAGGVDCCGAGGLLGDSKDDIAERVFAAIARLETNTIGDRRCTGGWVCVKAALERMVSPENFFKATQKDGVRKLFYLAKANMVLEDDQIAHRQLLGLKASPEIAGTIYSAPVDQMLETCANRLRQSRRTSLVHKLADLSSIFYHTARNRFIMITVFTFLFTFFFIRWHRLFKEDQSTMASFFKALEKLVQKLPDLSLPRFTFGWLRHLKRPFGWLWSRYGWDNSNFRKDLQSFQRHLKKWSTGLEDLLGDNEPMRCRTFDPEDGRVDAGEGIPNMLKDYPGLDVDIRDRSRMMVEQLSVHVPYPICIISRIPGYKPGRRLWYYMASGSALSMLATWVFSFGSPVAFREHVMFFFLLTATLVAALTGIHIMTRRTLHSIEKIATMIGSDDTLERLGQQIRIMFRSPWQFFVAFVLYGLFFIISEGQLPSIHVVVILIIFVVSPIHWMMISSLFFTRELCKLENLSVNPLSPLKTWGLQKWIAVIGTFATTGSIIITFSASIPVIMQWEHLRGKDLFWICAMLPLLLAYWIYPYFKIRKMVREFKLQRMHFIKANISIAYDKWQALTSKEPENVDAERREEIERQMDRLNRYHGLFKVIDQSPEFFVDFYSILELAKVMGFPSLFALIVYFMRLF